MESCLSGRKSRTRNAVYALRRTGGSNPSLSAFFSLLSFPAAQISGTMANKTIKLISFCIVALLLVGCANRGVGPQGGPKDSIPPTALKYEPENGSVNFTGKRIEITFNEYIQLDNVANHLLMSPPQQQPPEVKARGKKLIIQFVDSLRDSTTYTLDFGAAVCDFTEKNPHYGFSYGFSTGPTIDTLETSGIVLQAFDLKPAKNVLVGIQDNLHDSAFTSQPLLRIARTDSTGFFRINNMRAGTYRLYVLDDISRDYRLTPGESLAFADELLTVPSSDSAQTTLYLFKPQQQRLYLQRTLREEQHRIRIFFSASPDSLPVIRPLTDSLNWHVQFSAKHDTANIWLLDSTSIAQDSLYFEVRYRRTDSLYHLEWTMDTVRAIWRAPRLSAKAREALERKNRNRRLELKSNARKGFELFDTLSLTCSTPLAAIDMEKIHLMEKIDTVYKPVTFSLAPHDTLPMKLMFLAALEPGKKYELSIDSAALHDVYGITHIAGKYPLEMKNVADYATIRVRITPFHPQARIQVLDKGDKVLRELPAAPEGTLFRYMRADTYKLRLFIDADDNGQWTTGSWEEKRQPEKVYNFPGTIQTKSNWDFEEEWNYEAQ